MTRQEKSGRALVVAIALVAFNLRTPLTGIPTVVRGVQTTTGLGKTGIGLLTTLPVLCMGALALIVPGTAARFGVSRTVWLATGLLAVAMGLRIDGSVPAILYFSALLTGVSIAFVGGLVPGIVRDQRPDHVGLITGVWTSAMSIGAALAAALTVPLAAWLGSWQRALAVWALPAVIAWLVWTIVERPHRVAPPVLPRTSFRDLPWRDGPSWALTIFLAVNSLVFYSSVAWLAPSLVARGLSASASGVQFAVFTGVGILSALTLPRLLHKTRHPQTLLTVTALVAAAALVGLAVAPRVATTVWVVAFGVTNAGWFTMSLAVIGLMSRDGASTARLAGMVFTITYLVAAIGPTASGALLRATGSYSVLFAVLAVLCLLAVAAIPLLRWDAVALQEATQPFEV
ncbi:MAG TPA: MFS transporter [Acidimicrobiales bacterium]|nr:MFS transporter [Acidimicrobiales bacterium]